MQLCYDSKNDVLTIVLSSTPVRTLDTEKPGVVLGYGGDGTLVNFEIKNASRRIDNPRSVDLCVNGRNVQGMKLL
ncbi:DUF2283 domain-containing protein [Desulfocurvus vexinensis]|uniref:DUF2283 domain-containing protein n=1 Tax=Desulfocurvus vexinensis TaxID=399548 RepID=UPI00048C1C08|nr:DUF2283 domain-containing protein [Desulfocurvus vexinensis]